MMTLLDKTAFLRVEWYSGFWYGWLVWRDFEYRSAQLYRYVTDRDVLLLNASTGHAYKVGDKTGMFNSRFEVIVWARTNYQIYFPGAVLLLEGDANVLTPQRAIAGSDEAVRKINEWYAITSSYENYDTEEYWNAMQDFKELMGYEEDNDD